MNVFTRSLTDELASLVKQIDAQVAKNSSQNMKGFVVLLTDDPDAAEEQLVAFAKKHDIKQVPLTIFDGIAGPSNYNIAKDAEVTVNMWVKLKSKANHAFAKGELNKKQIAKVVADSSKILN
ncbi:MAG TPA: hypothetical protein QF564_05400 [Pirellulaceae bacterium]|nr:hypothetical protein [Pirellulaceae bacterium]